MLCSSWLLLAGPVWAGNYFQGVSPATVPWSNGIVPYLFDTNYTITATESNVILAGLREWELAARVKFVPYTNQNHYVLLQFTNDGSGTGFYLNYPPGAGTAATMMLHGLSRGLMCHEGGHLFGLQHEHQRIDRDNYILINTNNIVGGTNADSGLSAFFIDTNSTPFGPYDFESAMHYTPGNFSIGAGFDSLDPLPPYQRFLHKLGNLALSIGDRAAVANLYGPPTTPLTNIITTTADGGSGSLRAAIYYANDHPGTTIRFNIPNTDPGYSNGVFTIYLIGELPPLVSAGTVIDGTTEPGYSGSPVIALDGSQVSPEAFAISGLHLYGTDCTVRALAFDNFAYAGVQLFCSDAVSNHVEGCSIGVQPDGINAAPDNLAGVIFQFGPHNNFIGGASVAQRNIISGNTYYGVQINDTNSDSNAILGNYIGLNKYGSAAVPNGYSGIGIWDGPVGTIIGGTNTGARNVISGNDGDGINLSYSNVSGVVIQGNYIGTDFTGANAVPNGNAGVDVFSGAHGMIIGGTNAAARNVISGNGYAGVILAGAGVTDNLVQGNYVGTYVNAIKPLPNGQIGIGIWGGASGNFVGGTNAGARNVISGNSLEGVYVGDPGTTGNVVQGNFIGTDVAGTHVIANGDIGVGIWNGASSNLIVGNLLSGNNNYGLVIGGAFANTVQGNLIGTDITGTNALGNRFTGAAIWGAATGNLIGGTTGAAGNIISGNATYGLFISDTNTTGNFVEGNAVGTNVTGKRALANGFAGVAIFNQAAANIIGGTTAGTTNLISGNGTYGVFISDTNTTGNLVEGNLIGTDITGTNALGNGTANSSGANVELQQGAVGNFIGGTAAGAGNVIAFGSVKGVLLYDPATTNNAIRGNSIFGNTNLGIDLNNDGVTPNHAGFLAGPNDLQNYPVITNAFGFGSSTDIAGTLNSTANRPYYVDVYRNPVPDPSGHGQGKFYLGSVNVTTDGSGNGTFAMTVAGNYTGQYLSSTATSAGGDTSEFGLTVLATNYPGPLAEFIEPYQSRTNGFTFSLLLQTNFNYRIQAATNPVASAVWTDLTNFVATNSLFNFIDHSATNYRVRFYRVASP